MTTRRQATLDPGLIHSHLVYNVKKQIKALIRKAIT
jgi:hypothetical protein